MRATDKGRDLIKAIILGAILSWLLDVRVTLALSLALALTALTSLVILRLASGREVKISVEPNKLRGFKGERLRAGLRIPPRARRWTRIHISSLNLPIGLDGSVEKTDNNSAKLVFAPKFAGRFVGLRMKLELRDPLNLFARPIESVHEDFRVDSLPYSLLTPATTSPPAAIALGERPSGVPGFGQEFYGVQEYSVYGEAKSILWKRVARLPDERLILKVRESNIRRIVRMAMLENFDRKESRPKWVDAVCEATGQIGKTLLAMGCRLEIVCESDRGPNNIYASTFEELADSIMTMWVVNNPGGRWLEVVRLADIVVTGMREVESPALATALSSKPSVLIQEGASPALVGEQALVFSGSEDVSRLVRRVVER